MPVLSSHIKRRIRKNNKLKGLLMGLYDRREQTILNYLKLNDPRMTTAPAVRLITKELEVAKEDIIETVSVTENTTEAP